MAQVQVVAVAADVAVINYILRPSHHLDNATLHQELQQVHLGLFGCPNLVSE